MKFRRCTILILSLAACPAFADGFDMEKNPTDIAGDLIKPAAVDESSIRTMEFKGNEIRVTHKVPDRFHGTYELPPERTPSDDWAKRFILNADGTGVDTDYLCGQCEDPDDHFEWGLVVEEDTLLVGEYSVTDHDASGDATRERYRAHKIIFKYTGSDDGFGHNVLYNDNGRLTLIGPYSAAVYKK